MPRIHFIRNSYSIEIHWCTRTAQLSSRQCWTSNNFKLKYQHETASMCSECGFCIVKVLCVAIFRDNFLFRLSLLIVDKVSNLKWLRIVACLLCYHLMIYPNSPDRKNEVNIFHYFSSTQYSLGYRNRVDSVWS